MGGCWVPTLRPLTPLGKRFVSTSEAARVLVAGGATTEVRAAAGVLAEHLSHITGKSYAVQLADPSSGAAGVWLGTAAELPMFAKEFSADSSPASEAYLVRSLPTRILLVAAKANGVQHVVWDFLHQLGYRHYFPGPEWVLEPRLDRLELQTDRVCIPAWWQRRLWFSFGTWPDNASEFDQWSRENRLGGLRIETGHSYGRIVSGNRAEFSAHPEYTASGDSSASAVKFCVAEPGLVELVKRWALRHFELNPTADSLSLEPSDGGGWEGCPRDAELGSPSNRAVTLANAVAEAINQNSAAPRYVGMYAYNEHAPPPTIPLHPNLAVFVANAYLPAGLDMEGALRGWRAAGTRPSGPLLGIREYYSVNTWDRDRPGVSRASSPDDLVDALVRYHRLGARLFTAESSDGWAAQGLGYWVAAATLWTSDAPVATSLYVDDFLQGAFGKAAPVMREFYQRIDGHNKPFLCAEQVGELYRLLGQASKLEVAADVTRRLNALGLYVRYLDLWLDYEFADTSQQGEKLDALLRYTFRIRREHMVHGYALRRDLTASDRRRAFADITSKRPEDDPWRDDRRIAPQALKAWLDEGSLRPRLPEERTVVGPLARLFPAKAIGDTAKHQVSLRGNQQFQLLFDRSGDIELGLQAGTVRLGGEVELRLCAADDSRRPCQVRKVPADRAIHQLSFAIEHSGQYVLDLVDSRRGAVLSWPAGTAITLRATQRERPALSSRWSLYLFVPRGTRTLELYSEGGTGSLRDASGRVVHRFAPRPGVVNVPVAPGQDGTCWLFDSNKGYRIPLNVPALFAAAPDELLVPADSTRGAPQRDAVGPSPWYERHRQGPP